MTGEPASARAAAMPRPSPRLAPTTMVVVPDRSLTLSPFLKGHAKTTCHRETDTTAQANWSGRARPVSRGFGVGTNGRMLLTEVTHVGRAAPAGADRRPRRVRGPGRTAPRRAASALLSPARVT